MRTLGVIMMQRRRIATAACLALVASCSTPSDDAPDSTATSEQTHRTPLALVVHHQRAIDNLSLADAEALLAGDIDSWAQIGGGAGRLRVERASTAVDDVASNPDVLGIVPADAVTPRVRAIDVDGHDALRNDPEYPLTTRTKNRPGQVLVTAIVGDIMLGRRVGDHLDRMNDPAAVLRPFAKRLAGADITVGNLESTLSDDGRPRQGGDSFAADPSVLEGLEAAGFDVLSLANNHVGDFGRGALLETVEILTDAGFQHTGAGRDLAQARAPSVVERRGVRIGFIATDSIGETPAATRDAPGTNRINAPPRTGPLDRGALDRVASDIRALDKRVDVVVVLPHWGTQYTNRPERSQRTMARGFVDAGADLVVGGHPHWVQGWETNGDATVVHSLGNFVFDLPTQENQQGLVLEVVTRGDRVVAIDTVPYVIGTRDFTPRPAPDRNRVEAIYDLVRDASEPPFDALRP